MNSTDAFKTPERKTRTQTVPPAPKKPVAQPMFDHVDEAIAAGRIVTKRGSGYWSRIPVFDDDEKQGPQQGPHHLRY